MTCTWSRPSYFLGKRRQDTLPYYYSAAEVVVMPSHYKSFGMVALEAMACGTPVIASDVGGLGFLVQDGETGFTIPDGEPDLLCRPAQLAAWESGAKGSHGSSRGELRQGLLLGQDRPARSWTCTSNCSPCGPSRKVAIDPDGARPPPRRTPDASIP